MKHSKDLIEIFNTPAENGRVVYNEYEVQHFYVKWAESNPLFPYADEHLKNKKYKETWNAYLNGQNYAEKKIGDIINKFLQYEEIVWQKLSEAQIQNLIIEQFTDLQARTYMQKKVGRLIYHNVLNIVKYNIKYKIL